MRSLICSALCGLLFAADLPAASFNNLLRTLGQEGFGTPEYDGALQEIARDHTKDPNFSRIYRFSDDIALLRSQGEARFIQCYLEAVTVEQGDSWREILQTQQDTMLMSSGRSH